MSDHDSYSDWGGGSQRKTCPRLSGSIQILDSKRKLAARSNEFVLSLLHNYAVNSNRIPVRERPEQSLNKRLDRCTTALREVSRLFRYKVEPVAVSVTGEKQLGYSGRTELDDSSLWRTETRLHRSISQVARCVA
jgi:hypothetical protein